MRCFSLLPFTLLCFVLIYFALLWFALFCFGLLCFDLLFFVFSLFFFVLLCFVLRCYLCFILFWSDSLFCFDLFVLFCFSFICLVMCIYIAEVVVSRITKLRPTHAKIGIWWYNASVMVSAMQYRKKPSSSVILLIGEFREKKVYV